MVYLQADFYHQFAFKQNATFFALVRVQWITGGCAGGYFNKVKFKRKGQAAR